MCAGGKLATPLIGVRRSGCGRKAGHSVMLYLLSYSYEPVVMMFCYPSCMVAMLSAALLLKRKKLSLMKV